MERKNIVVTSRTTGSHGMCPFYLTGEVGQRIFKFTSGVDASHVYRHTGLCEMLMSTIFARTSHEKKGLVGIKSLTQLIVLVLWETNDNLVGDQVIVNLR